MSQTNDATLEVVSQWVEKAESDFKSAAFLLQLKHTCPTDSVCFHVQQCIEKYVKALLVLTGVDFGRTHHISMLIELLPEESRPSLTAEEQERLTDYAVTTRYPGDYDPITLAEARQAVQLARRARRQMRQRLHRAL
ncbi:MAG TPA: HEPN domain-containing protein [Anaerolineae bacterium]|nr:HEPN domain-containing protein [Anaerolineae bacterium]